MASKPLIIRPTQKDLGEGFMVRRALPSAQRRHIGPFVFLDEFGPTRFAAGQGLDVRPHPHIGLSTVTYVFSGTIEHKDTTGAHQVIAPGDVNLMTAGCGIVHSERSPAPRAPHTLHGLQYWMALPLAKEDIAPAFEHTPSAHLPRWHEGGAAMTLVIGCHGPHVSPVTTYAPTVMIDMRFDAGGAIAVGQPGEEAGVYVIAGAARVNGVEASAGTLAALEGSAQILVDGPCHAVAFGGAPLDGERRLWWNFVASSQDRIDAAKARYASGAMGLPAGENEFIPLPD